MNKSSTNKDAILALTLLFLLLYLSLHQLLFIYLAIGIILLSFLWSGFTIAADIAWKRVGDFLGKISGTVILSLLFFLIVCPISFGLKLFGKDHLQLKQPKRGSNFEVLHKNYLKVDLQNPY